MNVTVSGSSEPSSWTSGATTTSVSAWSVWWARGPDDGLAGVAAVVPDPGPRPMAGGRAVHLVST